MYMKYATTARTRDERWNRSGGGDSHIKRMGVLVGNFEKNP